MKKKDEKENTPQEQENTAAPEATAEEAPQEKPEEKPEETAEKAPEAGSEKADAAENPGAEKNADAGKEKKLSENDVLKIYLDQAISELKRTKDECSEKAKQIETLNAKAAQIAGKYESLTAEYENYRRRTAAEKESLYGEAVAKAVTALLPALDSLERAVPYADSNPESFKDGVQMTLKLLSDGFKSLGVEEIEADGSPFNPELHNAVMHVEDENVSESVVAEVFQKGYKIGDRVIRHSMVKVAN